ncbi:MAG: 30S ribosomal protein S18 [Candidatus Levybacteria bacterium RIFCSPHIGHO2_02_FULL_42_12]|nr:MAG: 30S ribosomal protein S18 [Candidatus Levybacteria bacterium RIFCSPHIGHO2_02_FULL_42_12]
MKKTRNQRILRRPKRDVPSVCSFCKEDKKPHFSDTQTLSRFLTERGKIIGRSKSGLCNKHQKKITLAIKHARHLAMLPFIVRA